MTFLSLVAFQLGGAQAPPLATPMHHSVQKRFFFIFQSCYDVGLMTKVSLQCSIFFNVDKSGKYGKDFFTCFGDLVSNFGGFYRRMALMVGCCMPLRYSIMLTGISWLSKWQTIKAFHIDAELRQGCVLFPLFFIVYVNWINKCSQADEFVSIRN